MRKRLRGRSGKAVRDLADADHSPGQLTDLSEPPYSILPFSGPDPSVPSGWIHSARCVYARIGRSGLSELSESALGGGADACLTEIRSIGNWYV